MKNPAYCSGLLPVICVVFFLLLAGCSGGGEPNAQQIVDAAIRAHGGKKYDHSIVSFRFRDRQYRALRDGGAFVYSRTFTDSTGQHVHDVLRNSGFSRTINDAEVTLPEDRKAAYSASVNSVIYFALLPYFLNDDAVQKAYAGEATIKGEPYYKVRVTFAQQGGGEDHEDTYMYWFHQQQHTMDYLAYTFREDNGDQGSRFRVAVNPRNVGGIRFQDYINYTSKTQIPLEQYDSAYEAGKLEKVSDINLEELAVQEVK
ncbi:hypothetical protein I2I11_11565 [Pontibacter sp. 172403-2]|uniref:DUF6503 family protein n=1 Tax=Pontibacter rufus TaxID=2791028 RepID=UPI0018B004D2|nr:DUF6503 family protein [Pontibacter sp. 172403-2]MBF9253932.1 hypothetical protein [Pontibacter sp. 172403-2]